MQMSLACNNRNFLNKEYKFDFDLNTNYDSFNKI